MRLVTGFDLDKKSLYEFRLKPGRVKMMQFHYILSAFKEKGTKLKFDRFLMFCDGAPSQYKKYIESLKNRPAYTIQRLPYIEDVFVLDEEKAIKKYCFDATKKLNLLQESYLVHDHRIAV